MSFQDDVMAGAAAIQAAAIKLAVGEVTNPETYFKDIVRSFHRFTEMPEPSHFDPGISHLEQVISRLASEGDHYDLVAHKKYEVNGNFHILDGSIPVVAKWHGHGADDFNDNFVLKYPPMLSHQFYTAVTLRAALQSYQFMWQKARDDLLNLQKNTVAALEKSHRCTQSTWTIVFTVVEAVAVIAAVPTAGGSVVGGEMALAVVAAVFGAAANWPHEEKKEQENVSELAVDIIDDMYEGVRSLGNYINDQIDKINNTLAENNAYINQHRVRFVAPRPILTTANAGNITSQDQLGTAS